MANTLTAIIPNMTTAVQSVLAEKASLPALCQADFRAEEAALNETITIPIAPTVAGADRTPAADFTVAADRALTNTSISLTKDRKAAFFFTGDDFKRMRQNPDYVPASMAQAMRTLRNEIHSDLAALHIHAAGYYSASTGSSGAGAGTAGTTPFASNIEILSDLEKYLNDSLAPLEDRFLMVNTAAKAALGKLGHLIKANEAGTADLLRRGIIGQLANFNVVWDHDVKSHTAGTGASYLVNGALAAGATSITVDGGSGTILAGDVVTFAGNGEKYVVQTALAANVFVLTSGLTGAVADDAAVTVAATSRRNIAWHREALGLAVRLPAMPPNGDKATDAVTIIDPVTGMPVMIREYAGYGLVQYEACAVWGVKAVRPGLLKLLLG